MSDEQKITPEAPGGQPEQYPLPWKAVFPKDSNGYWYVVASNGEEVATCYWDAGGVSAALIAQAVNSRAALLAAAKLAIIEASSLEKDTYLSREALDALNLAIGEEWTEAELNQLEVLQARLDPEEP